MAITGSSVAPKVFLTIFAPSTSSMSTSETPPNTRPGSFVAGALDSEASPAGSFALASSPPTGAGSAASTADFAVSSSTLSPAATERGAAGSSVQVGAVFAVGDPWNTGRAVRVGPREMKRYEDLEQDDGTVVRYRRHENGDGLVAAGAHVDPSAFVAPTAWVDPHAEVGAGVRVGAHAWVEAGAAVHAGATLGTHVHVGRDAVVGPGARLSSRVTVDAGAVVGRGAYVEPETTVAKSAGTGSRSRSAWTPAA